MLAPLADCMPPHGLQLPGSSLNVSEDGAEKDRGPVVTEDGTGGRDVQRGRRDAMQSEGHGGGNSAMISFIYDDVNQEFGYGWTPSR